MEEKKHIDRLFQEQLKDFEMNPDASVWANIENQLVKKKKRRVLPLWLRMASVAATLLLLISGGVWFFSSTDNEDAIQDQPTTPVIITDSKKEEVIPQQQNSNATDELIEPNSIINEQESSKNQIATTSQQKSTVQTDKSTLESPRLEKNNMPKTRANDAIAETASAQNSKDKIIAPNNSFEQAEEKALATNDSPTILEENKQDIGKIVEEEKNTVVLEEEEKIEKKWSVGSAVAPVYYSSLREGSPIDVSLATNEKSSDISMSYGLKVNYRINNRLSLQSGISSVELGYQTKNVSALLTSSEALTNSTNIDTNVKGIQIITMSNDNIAIQSQELSAPQQRGLTSLNGDLNQFMNYLEIPTEVKYTMIQKKAGLHVIGGVSTYILYKNGVTLSNFDGTFALGEASNLNELNFSGNIGLDFDYELNKKLFINVSPMFKYQFNTFSKSAGGFQPYSLGIYTGLNFRF